jgi:hypothetical protein
MTKQWARLTDSQWAHNKKFLPLKRKGRRINNLLVFDLTLLFSPRLKILCIASYGNYF